MKIRLLGLLIGLSATLSLQAKASVLGAYYVVEQIRLNNLGYTQNIIPVKMPSGKVCRISYFHHRFSKGAERHILLHGFLDRSVTWRRVIEQIPASLSLRKNLILVDLPHHGDSTCAEVNSFDLAETFLKKGIAAIQAQEHFKVDGIWTGSLGGLFGLVLLNEFPNAQLSMVVPPLLDKRYADNKANEIKSIGSPESLRDFLIKVPPANQELPLLGTVVDGLLPRAQAAKSIINGVNADHLWAGYLKSADKVRILVSEDDRLLPIGEMDPRFVTNQKSDYQVVKGCGHSILRFCTHQAMPFLLGDKVAKTDPAAAEYLQAQLKGI